MQILRFGFRVGGDDQFLWCCAYRTANTVQLWMYDLVSFCCHCWILNASNWINQTEKTSFYFEKKNNREVNHMSQRWIRNLHTPNQSDKEWSLIYSKTRKWQDWDAVSERFNGFHENEKLQSSEYFWSISPSPPWLPDWLLFANREKQTCDSFQLQAKYDCAGVTKIAT